LSEEGLRPDVNSLDVLISLADLYVENGLFEEAKDLLRTAIKENPGIVKPYSKLSKIYINQGEENEAFLILKEALEVSPEDKEINRLIGSLKTAGPKGIEKKKEEIKKTEKAAKEKESQGKKKEVVSASKSAKSPGQILNSLLKIKGVIGAIIVDDIGALIDARLELPIEQESTGAIISSIYDKIRYSALDLDIGTVNKVFFELPGGNIIVLGSESLRFIVLTTKNVLLGGLEDVVMEAFYKTIEVLGIE
jgi:predicted regulator of Ras-like GTPase activity (Roadblock/LC7/MglB family)